MTRASARGLAPSPTQRRRLSPMFPEYRDLISQLKGHDLHFTRLFDKHNELDQVIKNKEAHIEPGSQIEIEQLKKEKLLLKDQIYAHLKQVKA
jgi:uncharacterized protein YdcH (DUF465 family)